MCQSEIADSRSPRVAWGITSHGVDWKLREWGDGFVQVRCTLIFAGISLYLFVCLLFCLSVFSPNISAALSN